MQNIAKTLPLQALGRSLGLLTLTLALAACNQASPVGGGQDNTPNQPALSSTQQLTDRYVIILAGDPTELGAQSLKAEQALFQQAARAQGVDFTVLREYGTLVSGLSVRLNAGDVAQLRRLPGVVSVFPVTTVNLPKTVKGTGGVAPLMSDAVKFTGVDIAQNELGLTGKGVRVGVIDSGIDLEHPAFAGRIVAQYDFVGDAYDAGSDDPEIGNPKPDPIADDCGGHGTHVAGIIGGNDPATNFKGVAPEVLFGAYRVFGCDGSANNDVILAAMERAVDDGMKVINMSLGGGFEYPGDVQGILVNRIVKRGAVLVAAMGNDGATGTFSGSTPAVGDQAIAVANAVNTNNRVTIATIDADKSKVAFERSSSPVQVPLSGSAPLAVVTPSTGCDPLPANSLSGKIALIERGTCTFYVKAINAQKAGASAAILYNNRAGFIGGMVLTGDQGPLTIPVVGILQADGKRLAGLIAKGATNWTWTTDVISIPNSNAGSINAGSSQGSAIDLSFKPDLSAPGTNIYSTWPLSADAIGYASLTGTSMASPHVAGVAALMYDPKAFPSLSAKDMGTLLRNTATPLELYTGGKFVAGEIETMQRQGAGMVNAVNAYHNTVSARPSRLALGDSDAAATQSRVVVLKNKTNKAETYTMKHLPAPALGGTTFVPEVRLADKATVSVNGTALTSDSAVQVTIPAGGETELNILITAPASAPDFAQYGGVILLTSTAAPDKTINVPYMGLKGDYQAVKVFGPITYGGESIDTPVLMQSVTAGQYEGYDDFAPATPVYTLKRTAKNWDIPYVWLHLDYNVRRLTVEVVNASGEVVSTDTSDYLQRNSSNNADTAASLSDVLYQPYWTGKDQDGNDAPNGTYTFRIKALKLLGDETNPAHTETYTSQVFTIQR